MALSDISIRNPVFAWMLMAGIVLFGIISFSRLGISQYPDIDYPVVTISVTREGAAPDIMDSDVVDVVEDAVISVEGIKEVTSSSRQGSATISVEFEIGVDIDTAVQEIQAKVAQAMRRLPKDIDPPIVSKSNPEDQPIMWVSVYGQRSPQDLSEFARNNVKDKFQAISGVGEVMLGGFVERNMRVWLDRRILESYNITVDDVIAALQREHLEIPAGRIEDSNIEMSVRARGEASSIKQFGDIIVSNRNNSEIFLKDIAIIEDGLADIRRLARFNGLPTQGLGIKKIRGANSVAVAKAVRAKMEEVRKTLPVDLNIDIGFDSTKYVEDSINEIEFTILLAVILTAFVCWLFLGSISSSINVLLAIPMSLLGTLIVIYFAGFTLNTFTLLAISLSIGIVVDDTIMVMENIQRHAEGGKNRVDAAIVGAREITFAALASTLAIVAIFLPVAFMKGLIGLFFFQFGVVITFAVLFSLLEALTLTPMRCSQFLAVGERQSKFGKMMDKFFNILKSGYGRFLGPCLRYRWLVVVISLILFIASLYFVGVLNKELAPSQDTSSLLVRIQTPSGSSLDYTDRVVQRYEGFLIAHPAVAKYFCAIGGFGGGDVDTAIMFVTLKPRKERNVSQQEFMNIVRAEFNSVPGVKAILMDPSQTQAGAGRIFPVQISIRGTEWDKLVEYSNKIIERMRSVPLLTDVDSNYVVGLQEVRVSPNRMKAADLGAEVASINNTISAMIGGVRVAKFENNGRRYDVRVRLLADQRLRSEDIKSLLIRTKSGHLIRLSDVVDITESPSLVSITRKGRQRAIDITANMSKGASQADAIAETEKIAKDILPEGYYATFSGGSQLFKESFDSLTFALVLGIVVAYMILASQFNSYIHPFSVLTALPFSISGAFIALWITNNSINMLSMIGIILLMGLVKKNSIILVDYTNQLRKQGLQREDAVMKACPIRLRPILMTSVSTMVAAVPAALAVGPGGEVRIPMAVTVIGGIAVSTFLTLFVVPCVYTILDDFAGLFKKNVSPVRNL